MCGIAGYLSFSEAASEATVRAMCSAIRHRGPDDEGILANGPCGIGMRRLSIIDLSTGHQPIPNEDRSMWIVFNGEVYNFQELRERLEGQGHRFGTHTDTEAILHSYEQEGAEGVKRLRGMFGFAIWDTRRQELFLARDRFGKKPLYYIHRPGHGFYFASEMKSLLTLPDLPLDVDEHALQLYLQFGWIPDPYSIYKQVRKLPPGHWMKVDRAGNLNIGRYWELPHPTPDEAAEPGLTEEQACAEITRIFDEAVRLRMIADVPVGAFLSGGIDSSLVVATMAGLAGGEPVRTFSIGWEEQEFNELPLASLVAKRYKTEHHEILVRPDVMTLVPKLLRYFDEPFADSSAIPTYLVSQFAAQHVKVVLSGDGGDELFGGYPSFFQAQQEMRYDAIPGPVRGMMSAVSEVLPYSAYGKNFLRAVSRPNGVERYFEGISFSSYFMRQKTLEPQWRTKSDLPFYRDVFGPALLEGTDPVTMAMYYEGTAKLAGDILVKVDRMSMANSLEVRSPLLDHVLAEYASRLPNSWKTQNGRGKLILLKALSKRLPPELLTAPKKGFGVPLGAWFRGPLRETLHDYLTSSEFESRGLIRRSNFRAMLDEHDRGRRNHATFFWLILVLELWFRDRGRTPAMLETAGAGSHGIA